jgi:two-component system response regulator HydG
LVASDDAARAHTSRTLQALGHVVHARAALEVSAALDMLDLVLVSLDGDLEAGLASCRAARAQGLAVVSLSTLATPDGAVEAMRAGAADYLALPLDALALARAIERALPPRFLPAPSRDASADGHEARSALARIVGTSTSIVQLREMIARVARSAASVLISGETGTGKELVARALHAGSGRSGPFVTLNCAAVPEALVESELFGHARGAFTDARTAHKGLFEQADGGTLFLDEIGELPLGTQVKLLRTLQERVVRPVGGHAEVRFDARLVTATHRELDHDVAEKRFREDLYYRVHVIALRVPALRERRGDVRLLAETFRARLAHELDRDLAGFSPEAMALLLARRWPGNVRELENAIEAAVAVSRGPWIEADDFRVAQSETAALAQRDDDDTERAEDLETAATHERRYVQFVLRMVGGNKSVAARVLGYNRRTLHRKLRRALDASP